MTREEAPLLTVEAGKSYVLEVPESYSAEEALDVGRQFQQGTGARVCVLHGGVRLGRDLADTAAPQRDRGEEALSRAASFVAGLPGVGFMRAEERVDAVLNVAAFLLGDDEIRP